ncbi:MAG: hypothetical protein ACYC9L_02900 [Sulfuricaulis sp.]
MRIVKSTRTLAALAAAGHIVYPVEPEHHYVEEKSLAPFMHEGKRYVVRYLDGCFYPFVYELDDTDMKENG